MGTRADFYVGRGKTAEWLGSIAYDGYPKDGAITEVLLESKTEADFRAAVAALLKAERSGTIPDQGWPWPWDNSQTTDYSYAFEADKVYASRFGHTWFDPLEPESDYDRTEAKVEFPDMSGVKSVTLGERSGLLIITS